MQRTPGIEPELTTDIEAELWKKEMMIGSFGSMGAITRAPMGIYRSIPESRAMLIACMREIKQVAEAIGISLPNDIVDKTLAFGDAQPAHTTSSLQRDIIAGRKSEMESLIGAVVRMGHAAGLEYQFSLQYMQHCYQRNAPRGNWNLSPNVLGNSWKIWFKQRNHILPVFSSPRWIVQCILHHRHILTYLAWAGTSSAPSHNSSWH
jgi:hypothetical protein